MPEHPLIDVFNTVIPEGSEKVLEILRDRSPVVSLAILGYTASIIWRMTSEGGRRGSFERWVDIMRSDLSDD